MSTEPAQHTGYQVAVTEQFDRSPADEQGDWWGRQDDDAADPPGGHTLDHDEPVPDYEYDRARWKAHKILKDTSRKLCGRSYDQFDLEIDLTDPEVFPPVDPVARQGSARRYNPEFGYISGPHSTWVKLGDRPRAELLALVDVLLDVWQAALGLSTRERHRLHEFAREAKSHPDVCDEQLVTKLILAATHPAGVFDYFEDA